MIGISEEILETSKNYNIIITKIEKDLYHDILDKVYNKFIDKTKISAWYWEKLKSFNAIFDNNGWQLIKDFVGKNKCIIFFNLFDDDNAYALEDGDSLYKLLDESFGFEFYITNFFVDYLICFNHHETYIIHKSHTLSMFSRYGFKISILWFHPLGEHFLVSFYTIINKNAPFFVL